MNNLTGSSGSRGAASLAARNGYGSVLYDAFGRLRTSDPYTIFESKQVADNQPLYWSQAITAGGTSTHSVPNAETVMAVATNGDRVIRQTKMRFNYQAGKSQLWKQTGRAPTAPGVTQKIGLFDGTNGIYFENAAGALSYNILKGGVVTESVPQASWNGEDAAAILSMASCQIFWADMEWLGVGSVRCGVVVDGAFLVLHRFHHANRTAFSTVYMSTPNLPLRYEIVSTGGAGTLQHICSEVESEGGVQPAGVLRSYDTGATGLSIGTGIYRPLIAIRNKSGYPGTTINPVKLNVFGDGTQPCRWALMINPTVTRSAAVVDWEALTGWVSVDDSAVEGHTFATTDLVTVEGTKLDSGFLSGSGDINTEVNSILRPGISLAGVRDVIVLGVASLGNDTFRGSIRWNEVN